MTTASRPSSCCTDMDAGDPAAHGSVVGAPPGWARQWRAWRRACLETHVLLPLFALLLVTVIWGLALQASHNEHLIALASTKASIDELIDTYEAHVARNLATIEQTLKVTAYAVRLKGTGAALATLEAQDLLPPALVFEVALFDQDGMLVASHPSTPHRSIARHAYFQAQRGRDSGAVIVSAPIADQAGLEPVLHFSRRINDSAGSFAGVVVVAVDPSYFTSGYDHIRMGEHGLIGLFGADGTLRALRVGDKTGWGATPPGQADALGAPGWDGVARICASRQLRSVGLTGVVGLAIDEQLAGYALHRRELLWQAAMASAVIVVCAMLAWLWLWQHARMRRSARRAKETYAAAAEANPDAFYVLRSVRDGAGTIVDFRIAATNGRAEQMHKLSKQQMLGLHLSAIAPNFYTNGKFDSLLQVAESRGTFDEERENTDMPDMKARWVHRQLVGVEDGVVAIVRDVSVRKDAEARMLHMARHDALTGLPNRGLLKELLAQAMAGAGNAADSTVLVGFIDLDGFKMINDGLGHGAGDALLQEVTRRMQACLEKPHCVGRFGGDEFVLVLP
ncbi:MAG: diguanylate cyclase, partial [Massilia sp.]|nr:diguanylate cyclase [Massilia sp.]